MGRWYSITHVTCTHSSDWCTHATRTPTAGISQERIRLLLPGGGAAHDNDSRVLRLVVRHRKVQKTEKPLASELRKRVARGRNHSSLVKR